MRLVRCLLLVTYLVLVASLLNTSEAVTPQSVWKTIDTEQILSTVRKIAIERIVESNGHNVVEQYIEDFMREHAPHWNFEKDEFTDDTPIGQKSFVNLIATLDAVPGQISDQYLVLAAHYDSKILFNERFEAAIDSAVPCAILLQFARHFQEMSPTGLLTGSQGHNWGIKLIWFDGEEAFHEWTPVDSIYGSRHLAQDWASDSNGLLDKISLFVLLDLLGAPDMVPIPSRYTATNQQFNYFLEAQSSSQAAGMYVLAIPSKLIPSNSELSLTLVCFSLAPTECPQGLCILAKPHSHQSRSKMIIFHGSEEVFQWFI